MGVYLSLSRIKKDDSYVVETNQDYIKVDFDIKENFFVEYIDTLKPLADGIYNLIEDNDLLEELGLKESDFLFFTKAGSFEDGENVDIFFEPEHILRTFDILLHNKELLISSNVFEDSDWTTVNICTDFLKKAISDNNLVQFYWQ
ncbi:hypothetical protein KRX57_09145 [Weeksellaceae bacterium TAE3-ERU29]|nr:hypothetical protein [Weeksellaceae bacterium TAE3-ERU29]